MESLDPSSTTAANHWLNFHHLRYFHAIAKEGSLRLASDKLKVSQPSICAQVKQLEQALGETLYRRSGRSIVLTDFGRTILAYAEEIFALGQELMTTAKRTPTPRSLRLHLGILDSFPKLLSLDILRPIFAQQPPVQVLCEEGKLDDLLGRLGSHRIDAILSDEPPPSSSRVKTFSHPLGSSGLTFCAAPHLARKLTGRFPALLNGAPMLMPSHNGPLQRELEKWFQATKIQPNVIGEFDDAALAKIVAGDGIGVTVVPTVVLPEATSRYGLVALGEAADLRSRLYLIAAERRIAHPIVNFLIDQAARRFASQRRNKARQDSGVAR